MKTVAIPGNTYPVREQLKALGGVWDGTLKIWRVPAENAGAARLLVFPREKQITHYELKVGRSARPDEKVHARRFSSRVLALRFVNMPDAALRGREGAWLAGEEFDGWTVEYVTKDGEP